MAYMKQRHKTGGTLWCRNEGRKVLKATGILVRAAKERTLAQVTADAMEDAEKKDRDFGADNAKLGEVPSALPRSTRRFEGILRNSSAHNAA